MQLYFNGESLRNVADSLRLIGAKVADSKEYADARSLFRAGESAMGKRRPKALVTDGLKAYHQAYKELWWTHKLGSRTRHIRQITFHGKTHNNQRMERLNGEIRDREKVMRGLKSEDTGILKGYQIFHNYVRPYEALDGKTPAEVAGIKVEGDDKLRTLIENASLNNRQLTSGDANR